MKVKQLVSILSKFDGNATIRIRLNGTHLSVSKIGRLVEATNEAATDDEECPSTVRLDSGCQWDDIFVDLTNSKE